MEQKTEASQAVKFRKKPVEIEAIQWTGKLECLDAFNISELHQSLGSKNVGIPTLEGTMIAHVGDWIIKGVKGEFYPCKPDIFELTYERAALKAQPAPTEAWTKQAPTVQADYWHWNGDEDAAPSIVSVLYSGSARKCFVTMNCTYSGQAEMCDKYGGWWMRIEQPGLPGNEAQPSGNTGELMQGWDVDDLISNMGIEKEVAKARAELQADPAIIPSLLAVQGENSARLDAERYQWLCDEYGITWLPCFLEHHLSCGYVADGKESVDDTIDRARASAETGGVRP